MSHLFQYCLIISRMNYVSLVFMHPDVIMCNDACYLKSYRHLYKSMYCIFYMRFYNKPRLYALALQHWYQKWPKKLHVDVDEQRV